jgi:hypothetical protein
MKIALLMSGRINSAKETYENIHKNVVKSNDVDFFIICEKKTETETMRKVDELYRPKVFFKSDENVVMDVSKYKTMPATNRMNVMYMYLSRHYLKYYLNKYINDTGTHYDVIISSRMDIFLNNDVDINKLMPYVNKDILCIPNQSMDHKYGICDLFAIGNLNTISLYLDLYNSIYKYMEMNVILHPEILLCHHLKSTYMEIYRFIIDFLRITCNDDAIVLTSFAKVPNAVDYNIMDPRFVRYKQTARKSTIKLIM